MKLANGIAGISHNNLSTLSSHHAGRIGIQRFVLVVQLQQQRKPTETSAAAIARMKRNMT